MFRIENRLGRESQYFDVFVYTGTSEDIDVMQHIMIYIYISYYQVHDFYSKVFIKLIRDLGIGEFFIHLCTMSRFSDPKQRATFQISDTDLPADPEPATCENVKFRQS